MVLVDMVVLPFRQELSRLDGLAGDSVELPESENATPGIRLVESLLSA